MLNFVKSKLEENEGISSEALSCLLAAAGHEAHRAKRKTKQWQRPAFLLAASLAVAACGWFALDRPAQAQCNGDLTDVIELLRVADGESSDATSSLADNLLAWQDAPLLAAE